MIKYTTCITISLIIIAAACSPNYPKWEEALESSFDKSLKPFYHGVASGDPMSNSVIIWTRVTPEDSIPKIDVEWEVSTSDSFAEIIVGGIAQTSPERDYTVKVDVKGLTPGTKYFYRFEALGKQSETGQTKTCSLDAQKLSFAVVSCSNYEWGYFNSYRAVAENTAIDAVLHLGDYIYEYGPGTYGDTTFIRTHMPAKEIITLAEYRMRYSQYRLDPDLRLAHARHPFINIWDDHEIANNAYQSGAQNHQQDEGSFDERKAAAVRTFHEWLPIRENSEHYRKFSYGNLVDIFMLDERLEGRTIPVESSVDTSFESPERQMISTKQMQWLTKGLTESTAQWKIIGNQVIFSYLNWGYEPDFTINMDSWDGYPFQQKHLANHIINTEIDNVIFVTGDTHSSWAFEVSVDPMNFYNQNTGAGSLAIEFGSPSINSANANEKYPEEDVIEHEQKISNTSLNPHLKYTNLRDHGYLLITLDETNARADYYYVVSVLDKLSDANIGKSISVTSGTTRLKLE